jgi:hypothetical protein
MFARTLFFGLFLCSSPFSWANPSDEIEPTSGLPWSLATADLERYPLVLNDDEYRSLFSVRNQIMSPTVWPRGLEEGVLVHSSIAYVLMTRGHGTSDAFAGRRHRENVMNGSRTWFPSNYPGFDWRLINAIALGLAGQLEGANLTSAIKTLVERGLSHPNPIIQVKSALALHFGRSDAATSALKLGLCNLSADVVFRFAELALKTPLAYADDARCAGLIANALRNANQVRRLPE